MPTTSKSFPAPLLVVLLALASCRSPGATQVDDHATRATLDVDVTAAELAADELTVEPIELEGVRGGRIAFALDGSPQDVAAMLLDFDAMTGKRPWAVEYESLPAGTATARARWRFEGKAGVNPTIELDFTLEATTVPTRLEFHASKPAFGLAAFFGTHELWPHPDRKNATLMRFDLYIDSGLPFANATAEDLENGLREDARQMRAWMESRAAN